MALFSQGIPRLFVLAAAVAVFALVPPETLSHGPNLCLWRHLLHVPACPACGTLRALAAFFHGHFPESLQFNLNVVITGPLLLGLLASDAVHLFTKRSTKEYSNGPSCAES